MHRNRITSPLVLAAALLATGLMPPCQAFAKDWLEKVEVKKDGIDHAPIEVSAKMGGYTSIKSKSHTFMFSLYARATSGERIVAMKLGVVDPVRYFEHDGGYWHQIFTNRDIGSGSKRTVSINFNPVIPMGKIQWFGSNPKTKCDQKLQKLMSEGMTKQQVLSQPQEAVARAYFELDAVASRKNKAAKGWNMNNTDHQRDSYVYDVRVVCAAGNKKVGN
ncbi:hypothetical protein ACQQ2Q_02295 [Agrobacterium sp. ES01]|uniref:hypothetical protein n=1 Tax=Agrobacterium sp. ES01 TaxID=3420714 RepID=UPI003D116ABB